MIDVQDYGADPTGTDDIHQPLLDAIAAADPGDTILFRSGEYSWQTNDTNIVIDKSLSLVGRDARLIFPTGGTDSEYNDSTILFQGGGATGDATSFTAAVDRGVDVIPVTDASLFSVGDRVQLRDAADWQLAQSTHRQQITEVRAVDTGTNTVSIQGTAAYNYPADANIERVELLDDPVFEGFDCDFNDGGKLWFEFCYNPTFREISGENHGWPAFRCIDCWNARYLNVHIRQAADRTASHGEPLRLSRVTGAYMQSPRVDYARRAIDLQWASHDVTIVDPVLHNCSICGVGAHSELNNNVTILGGSISAFGDPSVLGVNPKGITKRPGSDNWTTIGTTITGVITGIEADHRDEVIGCDIRAEDSAIEIRRGSVTVSGCHLEAWNPDWGTGIVISQEEDNETADGPIHDVRVDATVTMPAGERVVNILANKSADIENLSLDLTVNLDSEISEVVNLDPSSNAVRNVEITGSVRGSHATDVLVINGGTLDGVRLHDFHSETTGGVVLDETCEPNNLRIQNCTLETIELDDGNYDTGNADHMWVTDNRVRGTLGMPGATNEVDRDNF